MRRGSLALLCIGVAAGCAGRPAARTLTLQPRIVAEQSHGTTGAAHIGRVSVPVRWSPHRHVALTAASALELRSNARGGPSLEGQLGGYAGRSNGAGPSVQGALRAGRVSPIDVISDSSYSGAAAGAFRSLAPVARRSDALTIGWASSPGRRRFGLVSRVDRSSGLGASAANVPAQSRVELRGALVSQSSRIETAETVVALSRTTGDAGSALLIASATHAIDRQWSRRLSVGGALGGQWSQWHRSMGPHSAALPSSGGSALLFAPVTAPRFDFVSDIKVGWRPHSGSVLAGQGGTAVVLDPLAGVARRQWRADLRTEWPITGQIQLRSQLKVMQLGAGAERSRLSFAEVATHLQRKRGTALTLGLRATSLSVARDVAQSMLLQRSREWRLFAAWTP